MFRNNSAEKGRSMLSLFKSAYIFTIPGLANSLEKDKEAKARDAATVRQAQMRGEELFNVADAVMAAMQSPQPDSHGPVPELEE